MGVIVGAVMTYFCGPYCGQMGYALITGAVAGAAGAVANGGNIAKGAFTGLLSGLAGGIGGWSGFVARGVIGGMSSEIVGGRFGNGFISAGIGGAFGGTGNGLTDFTIATAIGGTVSELTGGKFANGAASAAFAYAMTWAASKYKPGGKTGEDVVTTAGNKVDPSKINPEDIARPEIDYSSSGYKTYGEAMEVLELNIIDAIKVGNPDWEYGGIVVHKDGRYYISNIVTSHNESAIFWSVPTLNKIAGVA